MELSRQEYPNLLTTLQPGQAVNVLNDRLKLITRINVDIADWLQERRKVEELYVAGLRKLARRPQQDAAAALGIFQLPWQRIITSTEAIASSHEILANKIEVDVERPLREYSTKNREMQSMGTIQGNLGAIAKELEKAQEKSDKLKTKGGKANKVANVNSTVEDANQQWESQAPYVFEQLQSVDENRLNHLRDVLTQFQTHEADQVERNRVSAEGTLNALLNVETADEIKTFAAKVAGGRGSIPRRMSQPRRQSVGASSASPAAFLPPPVPTRSNEDGMSERSGSAGGPPRLAPAGEPSMQRHSGLGGLKRLGTVIGRRKSMIPAGASSIGTPEKEKRSFRPFGRRGDSEQSIPTTPSRGGLTTITSNEERPPSQLAETPSRPQPVSQPSERELPRTPDPDAITPAPLDNQAPTTNGILTNNYPVLQPTSATTPSAPDFSSSNQPQPDLQGFSAPPPATDEITRAQQEAAAVDNDTMPYNLRIRDKPIQEEEDEAQKVMNDMANQLRAQALMSGTAPSRKQGTLRGRREVRNTVFIPTAPATTEPTTDSAKPFSPSTSLQTPSTAVEPPADRATSDTTSIHSAQTLSTQPQVLHPEMHTPGLNASIVETVSTWFTNGSVTKSSVLGEIALVYNPDPGFQALDNQQAQTIRLDNFPLLEKVAANPVLARSTASSSTPGTYSVSVAQLTAKPHPPVAFKYQLHLDESSLPSHSPVSLTPHWKIEPSQASVIVNYALNPQFAHPTAASSSITLKNVLLTISLSPTSSVKAISALMQPEGGFRKSTSTVYWKLPELTVEAKAKRLIARFKTEGEGETKPGVVEARWEASGLGSALGVSVSDEAGRGSGESDPFADESGEKKEEDEGKWKEVPVERRLVSGKYVAE